MRLLQSMLQSADVSRFGWTLVHSLWEGAAVAVLLAIALFILRSQSSQSRYLASCAAMGLLLVLPIGTFLVLKPASLPTIQPISFAAHSAPAGAETDRSAKPDDLQQVAGATPRLERVTPEMKEPSNDSPTVASSPAPIRARVRAQDVLPWFVVIWAVGVAAISLWNLGGWIALQRLRSNGTKPTSQEIQQQLTQLCTRLGVRRVVRIFESARVRSPLMIGVFKPIILLPASIICELPAAQLESILAHELAHIRRHDYLVNLIQTVIETLLFYHPATWWISRQIRIERENCCDDITVQYGADRATYASALANIAAVRLPNLALGAGNRRLLARVQRVLGVTNAGPRHRAGWAVGVLGLVAAGIIASVFIAPGRIRAQDTKPTTQPALTHPASTQPAAGARMLRVKFVDEDGKPVAGVTGTYWPNQQTPTNYRKYTSDADGQLVVTLDASAHAISFFYNKGGYVAGLAHVGRGATGREVPPTFTQKMIAGKTIGGTVVDQDNKPVGDVKVRLTFFCTNSEQPNGSAIYYGNATTSAEGRWSFDGAPSSVQRVELMTQHPDFVLRSMHHQLEGFQYVDLLAGKEVSKAERGITVTGTVVDRQGKPVANAEVGPDQLGLITSVKSDAQGFFELRGLTPAATSVVVVCYARGYAPQITRSVVGPNSAPIRFKLAAGREIRGRVIDADGKPVPEAHVSVAKWGTVSRLSVYIVTDADGRFVWKDGPPDDVTLIASRELPFILRAPHAVAGKDEVILKLPPATGASDGIHGNVVDDVSGDPIEHFNVHVQGYEKNKQQWSMDRSGANGSYDVDARMAADQYEIRITAVGYLPAESARLSATDRSVRFNARLGKSGGVIGSVLTPDGKPAAGASAIVMGKMGIMIRNSALDQWSRTASISATGDSEGKFLLPKQSGEVRLFVFHESGWTVVHQSPVQSLQGIKLRPWCSIEGTTMKEGKPAPDQRITLRPQRPPEWSRDPLMFMYELRSDSNGHFKITNVPDGNSDIGFQLEIPLPDGRMSYVESQSRVLELGPGEQKKDVQIGGSGQTVIVTILPSEQLKTAGQLPNHGSISRSRPKMETPPGWENMTTDQRQVVRKAFFAGDLIKAYNAQVNLYAFAVQPDGTFRITDVVPGTYYLWVDVQKRDPNEPQASKWIAGISKQIVVPVPTANPSNQPIDVGTLQMVDIDWLTVGSPAPSLEVQTFDGKPLKLSDFTGKYVVVNFWSAGFGTSKTVIAVLKTLQSKYAKDGRLAIINLNQDESLDVAKQFVAEHQLTWPQAYIGPDSPIRTRWRGSYYPLAVLIGPDGQIVNNDLGEDDIGQKIEAALGTPRQ